MTPAERLVAQIWSDLLGIEPIESEDRFSELGGSSLLAERMLIRVRAELSAPATAATMTDDPTLAAFVERVERERRDRFVGRQPSTMVVLRAPESPDAGSVLCVAGAGATAVGFLPLAGCLDPGLAVIGFQANGLETRGLPDWSVGRAATRHCRSYLRLAHTGPCVVLGHSFGGHIAAELARRLRAEGVDVRAVVLLDTILDAGAGRSIGDVVTGHNETPPLARRLRTHLLVATAGLIRRDLMSHRDAMWEQAVRVQHRYVPPAPDDDTFVVVTDAHADQVDLWALALSDPERIVRVAGDHNSVLNDEANVAQVARLVTARLGSGGLEPGPALDGGVDR